VAGRGGQPAALWPERCKAIISVSGYLIGNLEVNQRPLPPKAELEWWYQYYFATERGRAGYDKYGMIMNAPRTSRLRVAPYWT